MIEKYKSELLGVLHQEARENLKVGAITEERMREYDRDCLVPPPQAGGKAAFILWDKPSKPAQGRAGVAARK
jgi:hypothetical protein